MLWIPAITFVVLVHLAVTIFVPVGLFSRIWVRGRDFAASHILTVAWAAISCTFGLDCPLTDLEMWLRRCAGWATYNGHFIEYYCVPVLQAMHVWHPELLGATWRVTAIASLVAHAWHLARNGSSKGTRPAIPPLPETMSIEEWSLVNCAPPA